MKIMLVFGTRPEAIKLCPLIKEIESRHDFECVVCVTGQHKEMLNSVLDSFDIKPNYNLDIMKNCQTLFDITNEVLNKIKDILEKEQPDVVLVQGDTTSAFASSLAAFYLNIPVGHVEAGLRTYDIYSPYPEEFNRQAISIISKYNFAPTNVAKDNLLREGKKEDSIFVTGNTVIDALKTTIKNEYSNEYLDWAKGSKLIVLTAHRRENIGDNMYSMFNAIKRVVEENKDIKVVYPIHKNPAVREIANNVFNGIDRIKLIEPLDVVDFHNFINRSYLILTDSGGIQEEATALGKPVLVMRNTTERGEGISAGTLKLVGTKEEDIYKEFSLLINNETEYKKMAIKSNEYGDGNSSKRIVEILKNNI